MRAAASRLKQPSYGLASEGKARWCAGCGKAEGAVLIRKRKMCEGCGLKQPSYGLASEGTARWCAGCGTAEGAVDIKGLRAHLAHTTGPAIPGMPVPGPSAQRDARSAARVAARGTAETRHAHPPAESTAFPAKAPDRRGRLPGPRRPALVTASACVPVPQIRKWGEVDGYDLGDRPPGPPRPAAQRSSARLQKITDTRACADKPLTMTEGKMSAKGGVVADQTAAPFAQQKAATPTPGATECIVVVDAEAVSPDDAPTTAATPLMVHSQPADTVRADVQQRAGSQRLQDARTQFETDGYLEFTMSADSRKEMDTITSKGDTAFPKQVFRTFDDRRVPQLDKYRRLSHLDDKETVSLAADLKKVGLHTFGGDWSAVHATGLLSLPSEGPPQAIHRDVTLTQWNTLGGNDHGDIHCCTVTGEEGGDMWVLPPDGGKFLHHIPAYTLFVFHGRLAHGGAVYQKRNIRVHLFIGQQTLVNKLVTQPDFLNQTDPLAGTQIHTLGWQPDEYVVETLLDKRLSNGVTEYQVKWEAFSRASWVPASALSCDEIVMAFEKQQQTKLKGVVAPAGPCAKLDSAQVLLLWQGAFPSNSHRDNLGLMHAPADYIVDSTGCVYGAIQTKGTAENMWITALAASPQRKGTGTILVKHLIGQQPTGTSLYVQADDQAAVRTFYTSLGFELALDNDDTPSALQRRRIRQCNATKHCIAMVTTCVHMTPVLPDDRLMANGRWFLCGDTAALPDPTAPATVTTAFSAATAHSATANTSAPRADEAPPPAIGDRVECYFPVETGGEGWEQGTVTRVVTNYFFVRYDGSTDEYFEGIDIKDSDWLPLAAVEPSQTIAPLTVDATAPDDTATHPTLDVVHDDRGGQYTIAHGDMPMPPGWLPGTWKDTYRKGMRVSYRKVSTHPDSRPNFILGSTCAVTGDEYKWNETEFLPRLNAKSRTGAGAEFLASNDTMLLAQTAERLTMDWAEHADPGLHATLLHVKTTIPEELRVADTIWTAQTLVGDLQNGCNHLHTDENDLVSLIIQMGTDIEGGATVYYDGTGFRAATKKRPKQGRQTCGKEIHRRAHRHGQFQVTNFETVAHEGEKWQGERGIISFYLNVQIYEHFRDYGTGIYLEHRDRIYGLADSGECSAAVLGEDSTTETGCEPEAESGGSDNADGRASGENALVMAAAAGTAMMTDMAAAQQAAGTREVTQDNIGEDTTRRKRRRTDSTGTAQAVAAQHRGYRAQIQASQAMIRTTDEERTVLFRPDGPLGLRLGTTTLGAAQITEILPHHHAFWTELDIQPGMVIRRIQGVLPAEDTKSAVQSLLNSAGRPLAITFHRRPIESQMDAAMLETACAVAHPTAPHAEQGRLQVTNINSSTEIHTVAQELKLCFTDATAVRVYKMTAITGAYVPAGHWKADVQYTTEQLLSEDTVLQLWVDHIASRPLLRWNADEGSMRVTKIDRSTTLHAVDAALRLCFTDASTVRVDKVQEIPGLRTSAKYWKAYVHYTTIRRLSADAVVNQLTDYLACQPATSHTLRWRACRARTGGSHAQTKDTNYVESVRSFTDCHLCDVCADTDVRRSQVTAAAPATAAPHHHADGLTSGTITAGAAAISHHLQAGQLATAIYAAILWTRSDPHALADYLESRQYRFTGLHYFLRPGGPAQITTEGAPAVEEAIKCLRATPRHYPALRPELSLHFAGDDHCRDTGCSGYASHTGGDGSDHTVRQARYGGSASRTGECLWFGPSKELPLEEQARQIVCDLIVDDGITNRSHRRCLLDTAYTSVGIACGDHSTHGSMVAIELATGHVAGAEAVAQRQAQGPPMIEMLPSVRDGVSRTRWNLGECRKCGENIAGGEVRETIMNTGEIVRHHMKCWAADNGTNIVPVYAQEELRPLPDTGTDDRWPSERYPENSPSNRVYASGHSPSQQLRSHADPDTGLLPGEFTENESEPAEPPANWPSTTSGQCTLCGADQQQVCECGSRLRPETRHCGRCGGCAENRPCYLQPPTNAAIAFLVEVGDLAAAREIEQVALDAGESLLHDTEYGWSPQTNAGRAALSSRRSTQLRTDETVLEELLVELVDAVIAAADEDGHLSGRTDSRDAKRVCRTTPTTAPAVLKARFQLAPPAADAIPLDTGSTVLPRPSSLSRRVQQAERRAITALAVATRVVDTAEGVDLGAAIVRRHHDAPWLRTNEAAQVIRLHYLAGRQREQRMENCPSRPRGSCGSQIVCECDACFDLYAERTAQENGETTLHHGRCYTHHDHEEGSREWTHQRARELPNQAYMNFPHQATSCRALPGVLLCTVCAPCQVSTRAQLADEAAAAIEGHLDALYVTLHAERQAALSRQVEQTARENTLTLGQVLADTGAAASDSSAHPPIVRLYTASMMPTELAAAPATAVMRPRLAGRPAPALPDRGGAERPMGGVERKLRGD